MATVSELLVLVSANTTNFQKGMAVSEASATKFGLVSKVAFGLAAVAAVKFVTDSVDAYNEHQEALLQLQTTIKNSPALIGASTKAFEEQATSLQNLTGFQDEEILKADAVLGRFGLTADQLQQINPLVLDYARATGQDAATSAGLLGKALLGNTRALKTVGISFTATGDRAKDFATIQASLESKVGGLAEAYGKTLPGQLAIAAAKFDDVKETVGKAVIPILSKLLDLVKPLISVLQLAAENLDIVVAAGIGFAAWKFIPALLDSIAARLAAMGFINAAAGVGAITSALVAATPTAAGFALAFGGLTAATAAWDPLQLAGDTEKLRNSMEVSTKTFGESNVILGRVAVSSNLVGENFKDVTTETKKTAAEQADLAGRIEDVTADMQAQKLAAQQLAGGLLGLTADALDLAEKQRIVNKMQEAGHDSGAKYNEAVLDLLNSQEQFKNDIPGFIDNLHHSGLSLQEAYDKVIQLGKGVGLTRQDVLDALGPLAQYKKALDGIPSNVTTNVITRFTQVGDINPGGFHPKLAGGGIVTRPTMALVGESGPEAVIPLDKANQWGGINGDIVLNVDGKTLARITRDQLLKLGNRNAGTGL